MIVSFAQNAEDVVLARAFSGRTSGLYVDVGAAHPVDHSVTKHFHDLGWTGINIDPHPGFLALLEEHRPSDVNLGMAVSDHSGEATFFLGPSHHPGGSTLSAEVAAGAWDEGGSTTTVRLATLSEILAEHVGDATIDFLKVDVEGHEREVISGCDWDRWRPSVILVEATRPNSSVPSHEAWEPALLAAGYALALFDGLNRFYARARDVDLLRILSAPANVFDDWVPARIPELTERLADAEARIERLSAARAGGEARDPGQRTQARRRGEHGWEAFRLPGLPTGDEPARASEARKLLEDGPDPGVGGGYGVVTDVCRRTVARLGRVLAALSQRCAARAAPGGGGGGLDRLGPGRGS